MSRLYAGEKMGVDTLQHLTTGPVRIRTKADITWDRYNQPLHGALAFLRWLITGKGPLSALGTSTAAFVRSDDPKYVARFVVGIRAVLKLFGLQAIASMGGVDENHGQRRDVGSRCT